jgi:hypothetical protein
MEFPPPQPPEQPADAGELLDQVLEPLLEDFAASFRRGLELLALTPERVMPAAGREQFSARLQQASAELAAARALRAATPAPMALDMQAITPWHQLVLEVWSLSAALRAAGVLPSR